MPNKKAWVVSVNMGYGHQRTAYPLREFAQNGEVMNANNYRGIPPKDKKIWEMSRYFYEFVSRFKRIPLVGEGVFSLFNRFQEIPGYYPRRDLSRPNLSLNEIYNLIEKGWGKHFISLLAEKKVPLITTFFIPAFMAEIFEYPGEIYCVVCDADISRAWASVRPEKSRIKYFVPNSWTANRLKLYGVKDENIYLTGFPLPLENIGSDKKLEILKDDLRNRLFNLDPKKLYYQDYEPLITRQIGKIPKKQDHVLTMMFSIGGAGAQIEIVENYIRALKRKIEGKEIKLILSAGIRKEVKECFLRIISQAGMEAETGRGIEIILEKDVWDYFKKFNMALRKTDLLWTKPSELSFYSALGVPLILAPSIGSQEDYNLKWILSVGSGIPQENPRYASQWIPDYLNSGRFAKAALRGFVEIKNMGTYNIKKAVFE